MAACNEQSWAPHFTLDSRMLIFLTSAVILAVAIVWICATNCGYNLQEELPERSTVSVGSFNTLLIPKSPGFAERKQVLLETLQRRTSGAPDILCLQEVFRRSEVKDIVDAVSNEYPYYASFEDPEEDAGTQPACTHREASIAADCQSQFCSNLTNSVQLFNCTVLRCWRFSQLSQSCQSCLTFEARTAEDVYTHCSTNIFASDYTAPYGVLLLSRHHLSNVKRADFMDPPFRTIIPRGYITAEVNDIGITVLCTHLTADLIPLGLDYFGPPQFDHYSGQQANEIKVMHKFVEKSSNLILLGDFNHGPALPGIGWELPLNYGLMTAQGLLSLTVTFCGQCTYCNDNILAAGDQYPHLLIDHIYIPANQIASVKKVERLFDDIRTPVSKQPLSDHFGVRAELFRNSSICASSGDTTGRPLHFLDLNDIDQRIQDFCFKLS